MTDPRHHQRLHQRHRPGHHHALFALSLVAAATLAACGGSDKDTPPPPAATVLQGTAAIGAPMAGASITVVDSDPATADPAAVTADADGRFSVDVSGLVAPLLLATLATDSGTAELLPAGVDPLSTAFAADGTGADALLHRIAVAVGEGGVTLRNLAAAAGDSGAAAPVVLTADTTEAPTLPASVPADNLPTAADLAALGARWETCLAMPVAEARAFFGSAERAPATKS